VEKPLPSSYQFHGPVPKLRGGLFLVNDPKGTKPLTWAYGERILSNLVRPQTAPTERYKAYENLLLQIGKLAKRTYIAAAKAGKANDPERPLAQMTQDLRKAEGHAPDTFLHDDGRLLENMEVELAKGSPGRSGYAGVQIVPGSGRGSHGKMEQFRLFSILCQEGLVLYADQMDPEKLRKLLAWRFWKFPVEKMPVLFGEKLEREKRSGKIAPGAYDADDMVAAGYFRTKKGGWYPTQRLRQFRKAMQKIDAEKAKGRKLVLLIPPRPMFSSEIVAELDKTIGDALRRWHREAVRIAVHALGYQVWTSASSRKQLADMRAIDVDTAREF